MGKHGAPYQQQKKSYGGGGGGDNGSKWCPGCRAQKANFSFNQRKKADGKCGDCIAQQQQAFEGTVVQPLQRVASHGDRFRQGLFTL